MVRLCQIIRYFDRQVWQQVSLDRLLSVWPLPLTVSLIFCAVVQHPASSFAQLLSPSLPTEQTLSASASRGQVRWTGWLSLRQSQAAS